MIFGVLSRLCQPVEMVDGAGAESLFAPVRLSWARRRVGSFEAGPD